MYKKTVSRKQQKVLSQKSVKDLFASKAEIITETEHLQLKMEEDIQLTKELQFYNQKCNTTNNCDESENVLVEKQEVEEERHTSPVLTKNPFIKKLSKFPRSQSSTDVIVKSRYFFSNNSLTEQNTSRTDIVMDCEEELNITKTEESLDQSQRSIDLNVCDLTSDDITIENEDESSEHQPQMQSNVHKPSPPKVNIWIINLINL